MEKFADNRLKKMAISGKIVKAYKIFRIFKRRC